MKKLFPLLIAFTLLFSFPLPTFAAESNDRQQNTSFEISLEPVAVADDPVYSKVPSKPYTDTISLLEVRRNQPSIEKLFARARVKLFTLITTSV